MRTYTAPPMSVHARAALHNLAGPSPLVQSQSQSQSHSHLNPHLSQATTSSTYTSHSTTSLSGATLLDSPMAAHASADTLRAPPPPHPPTNGGMVMASDSIINQVADSSKSLYQICVKLRQRLREVPGFQQHLEEMRADDGADGSVDPVESMWRCLRKGYPLMTVYNALNPEVLLFVDEARVAEAKRAKTASFKFVQACLKDLNFPPDECFLIMDLYGDDTTGFVKVTTVVNRVLDILQQRDLLLQAEVSETTMKETNQTMTRRDYIVGELVNTERKYVQDLETLQGFKKLVEEKGEVAGDTIHAIFLNLNALLDFQRRFLIRIETMNSLPDHQQNWGQLFTQYHDAFRVYEPYIANQQNAEEHATRDFEKMQKVGHRITNDRATLSGFIMKPFQRLSKYPLLLKELRDRTDATESLKQELTTGIESAASVLHQANAAIERQHRQLAVDELRYRVEDWKSHDIQQFGELLLYGTFTVVKGDGRNDVEREVRPSFLSTRSGGPLSLSKARARLANLPPILDLTNMQSEAVLTVRSVPTLRSRTSRSKSGSFPATPVSQKRTPRDCETIEDREAPRSHGRYECLASPVPRPDGSPETPSERRLRLQTLADGRDLTLKDFMALENWPHYGPPAHKDNALTPRTKERVKSRKTSFKAFLSALSPLKSEPGWGLIENPPEGYDIRLESATFVRGRHSGPTSVRPRFSLASSDGSDTDSPTVSSPRRAASSTVDLRSDGPMIPARGMRSHLWAAVQSEKKDTGAFTPYHHGSRSTTFLFKMPPAAISPTLLEETYADEKGLRPVRSEQYTIYLFERILLCCKEQNPNKQKNKVMSMNKASERKGKPRLQLKGRIFMQNVTETLSLGKPGSYTIQIFWKGDPGVENFVIRFTNEETMKKWYEQVEKQREHYGDMRNTQGRVGHGTSDTEFTLFKNQGLPTTNPYQEEAEGDEDDDGRMHAHHGGGMDYSMMSRTTSNNSLRTSRPTTGDDAHSGNRVAPPRFPIGNFQTPSLTLHTHMSSMASPSDAVGQSYFSPTLDTPMSSRGSTQSNIFPFPRQPTPVNGWGGGSVGEQEQNRFTAPAMGRNILRPSLPAMAPASTLAPQNRSRSASSPDIHNRPIPGQRVPLNGPPSYQGGQPAMPDVPMPPLPAHITQMKTPVSRSQNNSPTQFSNGGLPTRSATQSPSMASRDRLQHHRHTQPHGQENDPRLNAQGPYHQAYNTHHSSTGHPHHGPLSSPNLPQYHSPPHAQHSPNEQARAMDHHRSLLSSTTDHLPVSAVTYDPASLPHIPPSTTLNPSATPLTTVDAPTPTQLKVKVTFDSNYVTLVVGMNISYQSLVDRIDAKLSRFTASSIGRGTIRLRYRDEDGDYVAIRSDEDIHIAFSDWREQQKNMSQICGLGEIQLFCQGIEA